MITLYFSSFGSISAFIGPIGAYQTRYDPQITDIYESKPSCDPTETNFHHVSSQWSGLVLNNPSDYAGNVIKFQQPTPSGSKISRSIPWICAPPGILTFDRQTLFSKTLSTVFAGLPQTYYAWGMAPSGDYCVALELQTSTPWPGRTTSLIKTVRYVPISKPRTCFTWTTTTNYTTAAAFMADPIMAARDDMSALLVIADQFVLSVGVMSVPQAAQGDFVYKLRLDGYLEPPNHHMDPIKGTTEDRFAFGDLSQMCVDSMRVTQVNNLVNTKEAPELLSLARSLPHSKKDLVDPKFWASLFLCFKFGLEPTIRDAETMIKDIKKQSLARRLPFSINRQVIREVVADKKGFTSSNEFRCKMKYNTAEDPITQSIKFLYDYNLMPTVASAWEMIPMSFLVGWFVNIDDAFESIDFNARYSTYGVSAAVYSKRFVITGPVRPQSGVILPPTGTTIHYVRMVNTVAYTPIPRFKASNPMRNWATGSALVISRKK